MSIITYHDIEANGTKYIMEWRHDANGNGHIAITETCQDEDAAALGSCDSHETYDFKEYK